MGTDKIKERASWPMRDFEVRGILNRYKTQTRQIIRPQPTIDARGNFCWNGWNYGQDVYGVPLTQAIASPIPMARTGKVLCPFGRVGDRLWGREAWAPRSDCEPGTNKAKHYLMYRASGGDPCDPMNWHDYGKGWRPSTQMPRWASRILLEITGVSVERLQDISEDDARDEGCERLLDNEAGYTERDEPDWKLCPQCGGTGLYTAYGPNGGACPDTDCNLCNTYVKRYKWLWESIHGEGSWADNPWVWVLKFQLVEG